MNRRKGRMAAVAIGAILAATFSFSAIDLPFWGFVATVSGLALLASLFLGEHCGVYAGLGVILSFAAIGIVNGVERGIDPFLYITMALMLAMVLVIALVGSLLGDVLRGMASSLRGPSDKA